MPLGYITLLSGKGELCAHVLFVVVVLALLRFGFTWTNVVHAVIHGMLRLYGTIVCMCVCFTIISFHTWDILG